MLALVGPSAPAKARSIFVEELNTGSSCEEPQDFFHVAIDLPGFGSTPKSVQPPKRTTASASSSSSKDKEAGGASIASADFLAEVVRALGKHYAYCVIATAEGSASVLQALLEQPNLASFLALREPMAKDVDSLHAIFQPTLLAIEARSKRTADVRAMADALLHGAVQEFSKARTPKYLDKEIAHDLLDFMRVRKWRGHLSGYGHSKRRALLTRLVGGMKMWKGERSFREAQEAAKKDAATAAATAAAEAREEAAAAKAQGDADAAAAAAAPGGTGAKEANSVQFAVDVTDDHGATA